ncbi:leucine--tRNA ligase [Helicobacter typhlonius]|uniref:leucine--tRNA ligase n=1 Tax=Helicobacter typhlonius TaxID=76936 RepID=UPI002FE02900
MASEYNPKEIESKWQHYWQEHKSFEPKEIDSINSKKKYILSMFPYPSGAIHMGHVRNYCIGDALARHYRQSGYNVLHPMGWDAFGMPAENAAIKHKSHPKTWTYSNIDTMRAELATLGLSFSQEREFATSDTLYTRFEQEFFIKMWEKGLIYRKEAYLNYCPNDKTILANEQVIEGKCWRCDTPVVQKQMFQYYIKITDYADELLSCLDDLEGHWSSQVLTMQRNWIGKSKGLSFSFELSEDSIKKVGGEITRLEVFTTRADTIFGVTYCALAPEHSIIEALIAQNALDCKLIESINAIKNTNARDRAQREKIGFDLGVRVIHPLTNEEIPVWVANFVLMEYGSGAIMSVPMHDERDFAFARAYNLPLKCVLAKDKDSESIQDFSGADSVVDIEEGYLINSGAFNGLSSAEAKERIIALFEKEGKGKGVIMYRLRDWGVSRQRYWGAPIPMVHCETCGIVPEKIENLPITLPFDVTIDGEGNPLDKHPTWKHCACPKCGAKALRESDTMDTFVQSSWYFLRYTTPPTMWVQKPFDKEHLAYWLNVDEYVGGIEHAILHLLYARFFTKVLRDLGYVEIDEPFANLLTQGMVLKNGAKMSKSKGNVVNPNEIIARFGADSARLFVLFAAPPMRELEWNDSALEGAYRFLKRLWDRSENIESCEVLPRIAHANLTKNEQYARQKVYEALQKSADIFSKKQVGYPFNTLIAAAMEAFNALSEQENAQVWSEGYFILLHILEPIVPHICWELSQKYFNLTNFAPISVDEAALHKDEVVYAVTINGKKRAEIDLPLGLDKDEIIAKAKQSVEKWLVDVEIVKEIVVPNKLVNLVVK